MAFKVYWCARDLAGWGLLGNHQFILIELSSVSGLPPFPILQEKAVRFVTLGGFNVGGNLELKVNAPSDVQSVKEKINPKKTGFLSFDIEKHMVKIPSPVASDQYFAETLAKQAVTFRVKTQSKKIKYTLTDNNCSAWANTMFKVAGVTLANRLKYSEFFGIDWGEEDILDESYFK